MRVRVPPLSWKTTAMPGLFPSVFLANATIMTYSPMATAL